MTDSLYREQTVAKNFAVIGAGSWGTSLAIHIARSHQQVSLWGHRAERLLAMQAVRCNQTYLPDIHFPETLHINTDLDQVIHDAEAMLIAVPSKAFRETLQRCKSLLGQRIVPLIYATKGLEPNTGKFLHCVIEEELGKHYPQAILSGPSFAKELALGMPTAVTIAAHDSVVTNLFHRYFHHQPLRIYQHDDVIGVELGGAYKNVIAIAVGIADGLGLGANTRAALITRGLAEMQRLGVVLGAKVETFMGLSGLGDLVLTATDNQSRNRRFGLALGAGLTSQEAMQDIGQVVEGAGTVLEIIRLARRYQMELPIIEQVHAVIFEACLPQTAVTTLLKRAAQRESDQR